jgi:hypothetical protein
VATQARQGLATDWFTPVDQCDALADPGEPESEKNPIVIVDRPTRYRIKPLDGLQFMEVMTHGEHTADGGFIPTHLGRIMVLRMCLKGWENLDLKNGDPAKFTRQAFHFAPGHHLIEIANHAIEISSPGADEEKNPNSNDGDSESE